MKETLPVGRSMHVLVSHFFSRPAHLAAMEGHLPCLKFIVSVSRDITSVLGARNDQGDTPKSVAEQFYKENCCTYLDALEWEHDHPEQAESMRSEQ
jgi:ankyrin repeat domain-containing protein 42